MSTKLIKLQDGTLVEVDAADASPKEVSGEMAQKVGRSIDSLMPFLLKICKPLRSTWNELNKEMQIDEAEVELGVSFEAEGNLYVVKAKGNANLVIKLKMKPLPKQEA
jgi:hypothetical protein